MRINEGSDVTQLTGNEYYLIDNGSNVYKVKHSVLASYIGDLVKGMLSSTEEITNKSDLPSITDNGGAFIATDFYVTGFGYVPVSFDTTLITDFSNIYGINNVNYDGQRPHSDEDYVIDNISSNGIYANRRMHVTYYKSYYMITVDDGAPTSYVYNNQGEIVGYGYYYGEYAYHNDANNWHKIAGYDVEIATDEDDHTKDSLDGWNPYITPTYANRGLNVDSGDVFSTATDNVAKTLNNISYRIYTEENQTTPYTGTNGKVYRLIDGCTHISIYYEGVVYHYYYDANTKYIGYSIDLTEDGNEYKITDLAVSSVGNGEVTLKWAIPSNDSDKNATIRICYKKGSAPTSRSDGSFVTSTNTGVQTINDIFDTGIYYFVAYTYKTGGGWGEAGNDVRASVQYTLSPVKDVIGMAFNDHLKLHFTMPRAASDILIVYKENSVPLSYNDGTVISTVHSYNTIPCGADYGEHHIYYAKIWTHNGSTYTEWNGDGLNYVMFIRDSAIGSDSYGEEDWYKPNLNISNGVIAFNANPWVSYTDDLPAVAGGGSFYDDAYYDD